MNNAIRLFEVSIVNVIQLIDKKLHWKYANPNLLENKWQKIQEQIIIYK